MNVLTKEEKDYLTKFNHHMSNFYGSPKMHKSEAIIRHTQDQKTTYLKIDQPDDLPFRPIVGGTSSPTSHLSNLIDILIKPLVNFWRSNTKIESTMETSTRQMPFLDILIHKDNDRLSTDIKTMK